jgi:hypothetical protein
MSPARPLLLVPLVALSLSAGGCVQKKVVAPLREQRPGQVTYTNVDGKPVWTTTGSAKYVKTVPLKGSFARQPHFTYVVFRDKQRSEDHIVSIEAAGDLTLKQDELELKDEGCLYRVVEVKATQSPVSLSLKVKPVELLELSSKKDEPRIIVRSDGRVTLKYPALWHLDDVFGLDEVQSIKHTKGIRGDSSITFGLVGKEHSLDFGGETAASHYAELERVVRPMAPHVQMSSGRNWWGIVIAVVVVLVVILAIIGKAAKK